MSGVYQLKKKGVHNFIFADTQSQYRLHDGALMPMLGTMRYLVEQKPGDSVYSWKVGGYKEVADFFDEVAGELVESTYITSLVYGRKPNPFAKDDNHWGNLYKTVAMAHMTKSMAATL